MPWYTFSGIYLIVWSALLVHCLFQREFFPIFGRRWGTKGLWLFTFVFLNPLLSLIYFVFGFLLSLPKAKVDEAGKNLPTVSVGLGSAIAIALIGIVLVFFELPLNPNKSEPVVISNDSGQAKPINQKDLPHETRSLAISHGESSGIQAHIGTINASNNIQTFSSTSAEGGTIVSIRNIMIICQSPHDLLDISMRKFQKSLAQMPYVGEVAYYPYGTWPEPGGLIPDVFIIVNMPAVNEKSFICSRYLKATIKFTTGSSIFTGTSVSGKFKKLEMVRFDIESQLEHESQMFGIESPQTKYKLAANSISSEMIGSIGKQFENLLDKYGRVPKLPQVLSGTYHEPPELSFLKTGNVQKLISGYGLFKNNHTIWRFADKSDVDQAFTNYRDELKTLGWEQENPGKDSLQMKKENEHICIFPPRQRDFNAGTVFGNEPEKTASETTFIADYESDFTDNQMQKAMDALLDSGVDIKTLLVFEKYFRTPVQLERLQTIIENSPAYTMDENLMLARYWVDRGQMDKGRVSLLRARAMRRTEKSHNIRAEEIKSLAEKLGDESLAEGPVAEEIFRQIGFINLEHIKEQIELEKSINEPVLFYRRLNERELYTFALRILHTQKSPSSVPYNLLSVESSEGNLRSSENKGTLEPNGVWEAETSIDTLTNESKSIQLKVKSLGGERFLFTITKRPD